MDKFSVDWFSFTISGDYVSEVGLHRLASSLFPSAVFTDRERGFLNYASSSSFYDTAICAWGGEYQKGTVHFSMPSSSIALCSDFYGLLSRVYALVQLGHCRITRLDFAFDDRESGALSFPVLLDAVRSGDFRSLCKRQSVVYSCGLFPDDLGLVPQKLSFGSRASLNYVRIYDKQQEQGTDFHWLRVELETKGERAHFSFCHFAAADFSAASAVECLRYALDFVDSASDTNISRCDALSWWASFCGDVQRVKLSLPVKAKTFVSSILWFASLSRSVACLMLALGEDFFQQVAQSGLDSLSDSDIERVTSFLDAGGFDGAWIGLPEPGRVVLSSAGDDFEPLPDVLFIDDSGFDFSKGFFYDGEYGVHYAY